MKKLLLSIAFLASNMAVIGITPITTSGGGQVRFYDEVSFAKPASTAQKTSKTAQTSTPEIATQPKQDKPIDFTVYGDGQVSLQEGNFTASQPTSQR